MQEAQLSRPAVDNLARNTGGAREQSSLVDHSMRLKNEICRPAASDPLHKKSIFCTKSSPLMKLYVQSRLGGRSRCFWLGLFCARCSRDCRRSLSAAALTWAS